MSTSSISSMRLSGLSSNLDTDSIVSNLMTIEQLKVDRVIQKQTKLEWTLEAHKSINSKISAFRSANMSVLSDTNLYSASAFNIFKLNLDSSTSSVKLTAGSTAQESSVEINSITQIAKAATTSSSTGVTGGSGLSMNATLGALALTTPITFGGTNSDEVSFDINGETFTFKNTDTLQTVFNEINSSDANVRLSYSELTDSFKLESRATGAASSLAITNTTGNVFGAGSAFAINTGTITNGQDAILKINNVDVTRSSNEFTIDGINYSLKSASATPITFSVERDIDTTVNKIKTFVTNYNTLVDSLQGLVGEEKFSDYTPLTETQKDDMSDDEITSWEAKAKSGLLRNDRNLSGLLDSMRSMLYDTVEGTGMSLSSIGLTTGSYYDHGKISLNEDTLRTALTNNPNQVTQLFTQSSTSTDAKTKYDNSGFLSRIATSFTSYTGTYSLTDANEAIAKVKQKVEDMQDLMDDKEDAYYARFTAMETALTKMKSQSDWLTAQFSS